MKFTLRLSNKKRGLTPFFFRAECQSTRKEGCETGRLEKTENNRTRVELAGRGMTNQFLHQEREREKKISPPQRRINQLGGEWKKGQKKSLAINAAPTRGRKRPATRTQRGKRGLLPKQWTSMLPGGSAGHGPNTAQKRQEMSGRLVKSGPRAQLLARYFPNNG